MTKKKPKAEKKENFGGMTDAQQKIFDELNAVVNGKPVNDIFAPIQMVQTILYNSLSNQDKQLFCLDLMKQLGAFCVMIPVKGEGQVLHLKPEIPNECEDDGA